jgi:flavin-dependent dehydrogenase
MSTEELPPRESMEFDVVIVGAGPSGLAAAIRLKQLKADLSVVVVEKGSEAGAHILSGAVIDPVSLDKLMPDWREDADCPLKTQVKDDRFYWMTAAELHDAAADEQSSLLYRLARQCLPLAGAEGRSAWRRNLPGVCRH